MLLLLLPAFGPGGYAQLAKDPQRDLSVSFSSRHEGSDPGSVFGVVRNSSINAYPCVHIEFNLYTRFDLVPPGEKGRYLGVLPVEVQDVHPRSVRDYRQQLPFPAGIGLKSVSECQGEPATESPEAPAILPQILSFTVIPTRIHTGQTTTLQWTLQWRTANADQVFVGEGNPKFPQTSSEPIVAPRAVETSGSWQVNPSHTTIYRLEAKKGADSAIKVVTVEVTPSLTVDGTNHHWLLSSKSKVFNEPVRNGAAYRLITVSGQLAWNNEVFEGLRILPIARGYENLIIEQQTRGGGVSLNEPFALYCDNRAAYIIHKIGPAFSLGFVDWDPTREPPMKQPTGIYQWEFRSPPGASIRDHRTRDIVTQETLALFNTSVGAYLVYDSKARTLRWLKP